MYEHIAKRDSVPEATAPLPPPTPGIPIERHPSNDDWGTTFVAILVMSLIIFVALGVLVKRSFRLVPTGVMALRTLVSNRPNNNQYHRLENEEEEEEADVYSNNNRRDASGASPRNSGSVRAGDEQDQQGRLELLSDSDMDDYLGNFTADGDDAQASNSDARVININTLGSS
ncbi:hypothetical protein IW140_000775 [Coemansia sp. RSA 1813]|nr:hypothetical protein EV178_000721 [Coemansia sp. RSA 1646]KAJ1773643.1 hypothetical protein LPJ74_000559 [Coemansia sp. RSA 1843]KAJ2092340.1 hypothetical protein IW138_001102 [Coemansia sp. RSA 986]KAJ2217432.1 hypothetical protein EV179_000582 [Coemansia sp. RSA 487]KAJ2572660.1 hypothetical protein IW140_000775 [Coemansia sp. RSA 1813]